MTFRPGDLNVTKRGVHPSNSWASCLIITQLSLVICNAFHCRLLLKYEENAIVLSETGTDYEDFKLKFSGKNYSLIFLNNSRGL